MVDYVTTSKHSSDTNVAIGGNSCCYYCPACLGESVGLASYPRGAPHDFNVCRNPQRSDQGQIIDEDSQLFFCPPRVWAFSLRHKTWKSVLLQELSAVKANGKPSESLWGDSKMIGFLESMLEAYVGRSHDYGALDSIPGKGCGLNILLRGNSGTGKTFLVGKFKAACLLVVSHYTYPRI